VYYLFIKMAQDNTSSYTIGMNSHHIFYADSHTSWLVGNMGYAYLCVPSYNMLKCTHVDMMFEFFFRIFGSFFVMNKMVK